MKSESKGELKRNTILIAISNLGSRAIGFILSPLYSYYLTTSQYGTMDLITSTAGLLLPFICLDIYEASFRYASDDKYDKSMVLSTTGSVCFAELVFFGLLCLISHIIHPIPNVVLICIISAVLDSFIQVFSQFARGEGRVVTFAATGVVNSIVLFLLNIILLICLRLELTGWIISFVVAKVIATLYILISLKIWDYFKISKFDTAFFKEAIRYCFPLISSTAMWWVMDVSDRYVISFYIGVAATGIYAVANKLPSILSVFENIFYQSWQTTAINAFKAEDRDIIYSSVFKKYFQFLALGVLAILVVLKPMIIILFADDFSSAWLCSSVLVIGVLFHALSGNLGTLYAVFKSTTGSLKTSAAGAITNLILNLIFIRLYGMNAAAWTTLVGYIVVLIYRWKDTRKFVSLKLDVKSSFTNILFLSIQMIFYFIPGIPALIIRSIVFCTFFVLNKRLVQGILGKNI